MCRWLRSVVDDRSRWFADFLRTACGLLSLANHPSAAQPRDRYAQSVARVSTVHREAGTPPPPRRACQLPWSPEGHSVALRAGPPAHPSPDRRQPEGRRLSGADGSTGAHGQRAGSRGRRVRACRSHLRRQRCGSRCPWRRLSGHPAIAARRAAAPDHRLVNNHSPARRHGRAGRMREAYRAAWRFFTRRG
jgi:hypothetical protein